MSVYFVYRSHYHGPKGIYLKRFENESVLAWFQEYWQDVADADEASQLAESILGTTVYGFDSLFEKISEKALPKPQTSKQLAEYLDEHLYVEGEIIANAHAIQVLTDDDELELAYYIFDDDFLAEYGEKAAFILQEDWQLPTAYDTTQTKSNGKTYISLLAYYDSLNLTDLGVGDKDSLEVQDIRLPDFCQYLSTSKPGKEWPFEIKLLRSQLPQPLVANSLQIALERASHYPVALMETYLDTSTFGLGSIEKAQQEVENLLNKTNQKTDLYNFKFNPARSLIQVDEHIAQLCLQTGGDENNEMFHRWIIFDDLWLNANEDLGKAILTYAKRWDVLS